MERSLYAKNDGEWSMSMVIECNRDVFFNEQASYCIGNKYGINDAESRDRACCISIPTALLSLYRINRFNLITRALIGR